MENTVVVTGIGIVCPAGVGIDDPWEFVLQRRSATELVSYFDPSSYRCKIAAQLKEWVPEYFMPGESLKRLDRVEQFSLVASKIALDDSGLLHSKFVENRIGVCIGTGMGGTVFTETQLKSFWEMGTKRVHPLTVPHVNPNAVATQVALHWNLLGPNLTVSTACSSGAHAIGQALLLLQSGKADVVVAGGAENPIMPMMFAGFDAMRVMSTQNLSPQQASKPFDLHRDGFVMGEGAGVLILETEHHAKKRNARIYATLAGYGASNGGYHIVAPDPSGKDAAFAVQAALDDAKISPKDVHYINAHGTSTQANDWAETKAIQSVFGVNTETVPVSSTKGATGHMIGAAGAVEACFSVLALTTQIVPPNANLETKDPACNLNIICEPRQQSVKAVLSNSFGFGNNNACLVFTR